MDFFELREALAYRPRDKQPEVNTLQPEAPSVESNSVRMQKQEVYYLDTENADVSEEVISEAAKKKMESRKKQQEAKKKPKKTKILINPMKDEIWSMLAEVTILELERVYEKLDFTQEEF